MNEVAVNLEVGVAVDDVGVAFVDVSTPTCALTEDACSDDVVGGTRVSVPEKLLVGLSVDEAEWADIDVVSLASKREAVVCSKAAVLETGVSVGWKVEIDVNTGEFALVDETLAVSLVTAGVVGGITIFVLEKLSVGISVERGELTDNDVNFVACMLEDVISSDDAVGEERFCVISDAVTSVNGVEVELIDVTSDACTLPEDACLDVVVGEMSVSVPEKLLVGLSVDGAECTDIDVVSVASMLDAIVSSDGAVWETGVSVKWEVGIVVIDGEVALVEETAVASVLTGLACSADVV